MKPTLLFAILLIVTTILATNAIATTTITDANASWNPRNTVTFTCTDLGGSGCRDINYSLNNGAWTDTNFTKTDGTLKFDGNRHDTGNSFGVWGDGNYIYLVDSTSIVTGAIYAYTFDGSIFTLKGSTTFNGIGQNVWGDGNYIYVAAWSSGAIYAYTFDGTNFDLKGNNSMNAYAVWGDGSYIYVADNDSGSSGGIYAFDFNGTDFIQKDHVYEGSADTGLWGDGTYIYTGNSIKGICAYNFNGTSFTFDGNRFDRFYGGNSDGNIFSVWGDGAHLYFTTGFSGKLYSYTFNGTTFAQDANASVTGNFYGVWGDGAHLYVPTNIVGSVNFLRAYDFNSTSFILKSSIQYGNDATYYDSGFGVWGDGNHIYLANHSNGIYAYDYNGLVNKSIVVPDGNNKIQYKVTDNKNNTSAIQTVYHAFGTAPIPFFDGFEDGDYNSNFVWSLSPIDANVEVQTSVVHMGNYALRMFNSVDGEYINTSLLGTNDSGMWFYLQGQKPVCENSDYIGFFMNNQYVSTCYESGAIPPIFSDCNGNWCRIVFSNPNNDPATATIYDVNGNLVDTLTTHIINSNCGGGSGASHCNTAILDSNSIGIALKNVSDYNFYLDDVNVGQASINQVLINNGENLEGTNYDLTANILGYPLNVSYQCFSSLNDENTCTSESWDCHLGSMTDLGSGIWNTTILGTTKDTNRTWTCKIIADNTSDTNTTTMNEITGVTIDTETANYFALPNTNGNNILTDQSNNYILVTHNGNVNQNITIEGTDFIGTDTNIDKSNQSFLDTDNFASSTPISGSTQTAITNFTKGTYDSSNQQSIFFWLNIPDQTPSESYESTITIGGIKS